MRPVSIGLVLLVVPSFIFLACGQDPGTTATSASSTSGAGGVPNCEGVNFISGDDAGCDPCDVCIHRECCAEVAVCGDQTCIDCVISPQPDTCSDRSVTARNCIIDHCSDACPPAKPMSTGGGGACGDMSSSSASSG